MFRRAFIVVFLFGMHDGTLEMLGRIVINPAGSLKESQKCAKTLDLLAFGKRRIFPGRREISQRRQIKMPQEFQIFFGGEFLQIAASQVCIC